MQMTGLIERKDPNTRYIALGALCTLCESADMAAALQPALPQVVGCLSDSDPGVKKRAIDLLVNVCDQRSVEDVSAQLLRQLPLASAEVRGDLVVKVAILAERYAPSLSWCALVPITLELQISIPTACPAGDFCTLCVTMLACCIAWRCFFCCTLIGGFPAKPPRKKKHALCSISTSSAIRGCMLLKMSHGALLPVVPGQRNC
jgi:hypothetical protein